MMKKPYQELRPLIGLIVFLLVVWMMRAASSILMPPAVAAFVVVLVWPLHARLERRLPISLSVVVTLIALLLSFAALGAVLWVCAGEVASKAGEYRHLFQAFIGRIDATLTHYRLPEFLKHLNLDRMFERVVSLVGTFAVGTYQFSGFVVLVIVLVLLLLIEVRPFARRLEERVRTENAVKVLGAVRGTSASIRRFMLTRTMTSGMTGLLTGLFTWGIGLDFPLVWGVLSFILNYIPVFGAIVAVIPPTLVALILPGPLWFPLAILGGLTIIHFVVGNYVDPLLQGHYLSLPPLLVFYSIVFWGWIWGMGGVILGVPLTVTLVITCEHFDSTRWVARLLITDEEREISLRGGAAAKVRGDS